MNTRQASALLQPYLSLLAADVRRELTVVTPESLGVTHLLHVSKDTDLTRFVPGISRRGMKREDRTVPRVCTAPSLIGCILGYASDLHDFHDRQSGLKFTERREVPFKGGYAIYGFTFEAALKPSRKLVSDVLQTDEHWLVPYNSRHCEYSPELLGKVFYSSVNYEIVQGRQQTRVEMFVEVTTNNSIWFDGKLKLDRGHWRISIVDLHKSARWDDLKGLSVARMSETDYTSVKRNVASMLSLESYAPASHRW